MKMNPGTQVSVEIKKLGEGGAAWYLNITPEMREYLGLDDKSESLEALFSENKKGKGKFIAFWQGKK